MSSPFKEFCSNPSGEKLRRLSKYEQALLYAMALFCIEKEDGKVDLAKKIVRIYEFNNILSQNGRRGFSSVLLALNLLKTPEFMKIKKKKKYPLFKVYLPEYNLPAITISYGTDLPEFFSIFQTAPVLGMKKELVLGYEDVKEYLLDLFIQNTSLYVVSVVIWMNKKMVKQFYRSDIGVIWNQEKCTDCILKMRKRKNLDRECSEILLEDRCYEDIRHGVDFSNLNERVENDEEKDESESDDEEIEEDFEQIENPYQILELPKTATAKDIKTAYTRLALLHHPDKGGDPQTFMEIKRAYDALKNKRN